jgi:iron complex outermembrane receptor protein
VYDLDTLGNGTVYVNDSKTVDVLGRPGGAQVFPGFRPDDAGTHFRTNLAGYVDAELDITKSLLFGAAVRAENYSDFGSTLTGKVTARYNPISHLAIRAAYSTGFRAPSLQQIYFTAVSTNFINGIPFEVGTFSNDSRAASVLGIPQLKEETSENLSFGITAMPISGLEITVDAYQIDIADRVVLTGNFGGSSQPEIQSELSAIGADAGRFFTNAVDTRTQGLDIIVTYNMRLGKGSLRTSLAGNYNKTEIQQINATPKLEPYINTYMGREDQSLLESSTPETKFNLTLNYKIGRFNAMLRGVYYGEVTYLSTNPNPQLNTFTGEMEVADQTFGSKLITDLSLGYHLTPKMNITIGANNLLDVYPDEHAHSANYSSGRFVFSRRATQFGFNGRFAFARLALTL